MPSTHQQLEGYRARLERELSRAFSAQPISNELIERLVRELANAETRIADGVATPA